MRTRFLVVLLLLIILTVFGWLRVSTMVLIGLAILMAFAMSAWETRKQPDPMLRRRNLLLVAGASLFLILVYLLSAVPSGG